MVADVSNNPRQGVAPTWREGARTFAGKEIMKSLLEPAMTFLWYLSRPLLIPELFRQMRRHIKGKEPYLRELAETRCEQEAIDVTTALGRFRPGYQIDVEHANLRSHEGEARRRLSSIEGLMGGGANLDLIFGLASILRPLRVLETGVAYGWSSLALLLATSELEGAKIVSVDMPYVKTNLSRYVGAAVPDCLRSNWTLIRRPDREGIPRGLRILKGLDFAHYDSDKTPEGRRFAYPLLWDALAPGGLLVSDDISDNSAFFAFSEEAGVTPIVVALEGKFAGILMKPLSSSSKIS